MTYKPGDNWVISDRSGKKILRSEARREWNGSIVHETEFEERHPQEFVKHTRDDQRVPLSRPRPTDTFGGPLTTFMAAAAAAGDQSITVDSTVRMEAGDHLAIMLDNDDRHRAIIQSVTDATHLVLTAALPWAVSVDKAVVDLTAQAAADLG